MSKAGRVPKTISPAILRDGSCYSAKVLVSVIWKVGCFLRFEWKAECDPFLRQGVSTLQSLTGYIYPKKIAAFVSTSRDCQSYLLPHLPPCLSQRTTRFFNYLTASFEANCSFENFISSSVLLFRGKSANWLKNAMYIHVYIFLYFSWYFKLSRSTTTRINRNIKIDCRRDVCDTWSNLAWQNVSSGLKQVFSIWLNASPLCVRTKAA